MLRKLALCVLSAILLPVTNGCAQGDDPDVVAKLKKHSPAVSIATFTDEKGAVWITRVSLGNDRSALEVLPHLDKLSHLRVLDIGCDNLSNEDLKALPALPQVQRLVLGQTPISDEGLKYLASMTDLRLLDLMMTKVEGKGFKYLDKLTKLETLYLTGSSLNDSAMPYIVKNFKRLKRIDLDETKVTLAGLLQLAELHWLVDIGFPDDLIGPIDEQKKQEEAQRQFVRNYVEIYKESKRKARAAGEDVPPDTTGPFGLAK